MRTRIKMCGTTRFEDALAAVNLGIDALGFIFVAASPRFLTPAAATRIIEIVPSFVSRVGVFVDSTFEEITATVRHCGLTQVQLHGQESPEFCLRLKTWNRSLSICKAFRIKEKSPVTLDLHQYSQGIDSILFDTYVKGTAGGTGDAFDWRLIEMLKLDRPLILAGGLSPENIRQALAVVAPFAVDVNSGVEDEPGVKNHQKLKELVMLVSDHDTRIRRQNAADVDNLPA